MRNNLLRIGFIIFVCFAFAGCTFVIQKGRRSDMETIKQLSAQVEDLAAAKRLLEERLGTEISDKQVKLQMMEKGLVITVVGDLLFDSGKAKIRQEAYTLLEKISRVLKENMANFNVGIEGYTDDQPIKHSGWKTNWELSTARALSVLHHIADEQGISPERLSAIGYGEYRPIASNDTKDGRQQNRRVEIVIQPRVCKVKGAGDTGMQEPQENLK